MTQSVQTLSRLIREIRTCFNQLKTLSEQLSSDLDVNPSMRAVLEGLDADKGRTVPELAKERGVSRQHIQTVINALLKREFVVAVENPDHERSVHYLLTPRGAATFDVIRNREAGPMKALATALPQGGMEQARALIAQMNQELKSQIGKGEDR